MILSPLLAFAIASGCMTVPGGHLTAGDLTKEVPEFGALRPETILGYSPALGARRMLRPQDLNRFLESNGVPQRTDAAVCIERASRPLAEDDVRAALAAALADPGARIELIEFSRIPVPLGALEFSRRDLVGGSHSNAPVRWPGAVRDDEGRRFQIWAMVRVTVSAVRVVAVTPLSPGQPIQPDHVRAEQYEGFPSNREGLNLAAVIGRVPTTPIAANAVITPAMLAAASAVAKGSTVLAEFQLGNVRLKLPMTAERSGAIGDRILLRHPETHKIYYGKVSAEGQATIESNTGQRETNYKRSTQ